MKIEILGVKGGKKYILLCRLFLKASKMISLSIEKKTFKHLKQLILGSKNRFFV